MGAGRPRTWPIYSNVCKPEWDVAPPYLVGHRLLLWMILWGEDARDVLHHYYHLALAALTRTYVRTMEDTSDWNGVVELVSTTAELLSVLNVLRSTAFLSINLKGPKICAGGQVTLLTVKALGTVYVIDLQELGKGAFDVQSDGLSLRSTLASSHVKIAMFDCRNAASALHDIYGLRVRNVLDTQLYFIATQKPGRRNYLPSLETALKFSGAIPENDLTAYQESKKVFAETFIDAKGGDQEALKARPVSQILLAYAALDIFYIEQLHDVCRPKLHALWMRLIQQETDKRVVEATSPTYQPWTDSSKLVPEGWNKCVGLRDVRKRLKGT